MLDVLFAEVRALRDLVTATLLRVRRHRAGRDVAPVRVWARIASGCGVPHAVLERSGELTPYMLEGLAGDARHAGDGARLEVYLGPEAPAAAVELVRAALTAAAARGVAVEVRTDGVPEVGTAACDARGDADVPGPARAAGDADAPSDVVPSPLVRRGS